MLGIRDILVRIRETQKHTDSTNPDRIRLWSRNTGTFTSFFKDKSHKEVKKTVEIKVFLTIFA
jgi:hypothetical protein